MKQINISKGVMAAAATGLMAAAGWSYWKQSAMKLSVESDPNAGTSIKIQPADSNKPGAASIPSSTAPSLQPSQVPQTSVNIYGVEPTDKGVKAVGTNIPVKETTKSAEENLREAFGELLNNKAMGKKGAKVVSTIPKGTKLLSLKTEADGVHIDLSKDFTTGGGSTSMQARLAQVLFTATSFDTNANVWLSIEGQKLEVLGGEGIEVPYPLTRQNFQDAFQSVQSGNN
jgi:spore germination protein GerM